MILTTAMLMLAEEVSAQSADAVNPGIRCCCVLLTMAFHREDLQDSKRLHSDGSRLVDSQGSD